MYYMIDVHNKEANKEDMQYVSLYRRPTRDGEYKWTLYREWHVVKQFDTIDEALDFIGQAIIRREHI